MGQKIIDMLTKVLKDDGEEMAYTLIHPGVYQSKKLGKNTHHAYEAWVTKCELLRSHPKHSHNIANTYHRQNMFSGLCEHI
jgi:hypothetical protein